MTPRDAAYLSAVEQLSAGAWCQAPRGRRLDVSGLSWGQWRGAQAAALKEFLVELGKADHAAGESSPVRLTPKGLAALDQHRSAQGQHRSPAQVSTPLVGSESLSLKETTTEGEPTKAVRPAQGGVLKSPRALDRIAAAFERVAIALEQSAAAKVERCGCGRVKESAKRRDGVTFMRCPAWKTCEHVKAKRRGESQEDRHEGPRVSSRRSEEERAARALARAAALAERLSLPSDTKGKLRA